MGKQNPAYMKDVILWFIGAGMQAQNIRKNVLITLNRAKPHEANFHEIFGFLRSLQ